MDRHEFRRKRIDLDLTVAECAEKLGVDEDSIRGWQTGRYRVPGWVSERCRELWAEHERRRQEFHARREAVEARFAHLSTRLFLGEVPDGWLGLLERFLQEIDDLLPEAFHNTGALDLGLKEKYGSLRTNPLLDCAADLDGGQRFWKWLDQREEEIERESVGICARCGSTEEVEMTKSGWRLPLCGRHRRIREGEL